MTYESDIQRIKIDIQSDTNIQEYAINNITYICVLLLVKCDIHKKNINTIVRFHP